MTIEERLGAITETLELVAHMQRTGEERMADMRDRMGQIMEAVNSLFRIAELHEHRLDDQESRIDRLEG